jgi:hypothetical protein
VAKPPGNGLGEAHFVGAATVGVDNRIESRRNVAGLNPQPRAVGKSIADAFLGHSRVEVIEQRCVLDGNMIILRRNSRDANPSQIDIWSIQ